MLPPRKPEQRVVIFRTCYGYVCCLRGANDLDMPVGRRVPVQTRKSS